MATTQNNAKLYHKLLRRFCENQKDFVSKFKTAFANDHGEAHRQAHTLKGVAGNIGARDLYNLSHELEQLCADKGSSDHHVENAINKLSLQLYSIIDGIESWLSQEDTSTQNTEFDEQKIQALLAELDEQISNYDTEASETLSQITVMAIPEHCKDDIKELEKALEEYDFDEAQQGLSNLTPPSYPES